MNKENLLSKQRRLDKKPNIKNALSLVINQKCKVPSKDTGIIDYGYGVQPSEVKQKRNRLDQYTSDLLRKLDLHALHCQQLFEIEFQKYEDYYKQIRQHIDAQYEDGIYLMNKERDGVKKVFQDYRNRFISLKKELSKSQKYKEYHFEQKIEYFKQYTHIQIGMIDVNLPEIQCFKKDFQKFVITLKEVPEQAVKDVKLANVASVQQTNNYLPTKQKSLERSENRQPQISIQLSPEPRNQPDDLGCDEELGAKASANTIRRRKYDVGRQNVIKEQDESDDTNSIISDS